MPPLDIVELWLRERFIVWRRSRARSSEQVNKTDEKTRKRSMTTNGRAPHQQPQELPKAPEGIKDILLSAIPPLRAAIKVSGAREPLKTMVQESYTWYGSIVALALIMLVSILVILSADGAPFVNPVTSLWTNKFALYVTPTYNWPILLQCGACALAAIVIACAGNLLGGLLLSSGVPATRLQAKRLAGYGAIGVACAYLVTLLSIAALGWILYLLKVHIFMYGWMIIAAVTLLPFATWRLARIFRRTTLPQKSSILAPLLISMATVTSCAVGAISIIDGLSEASLKNGHIVNSVRNTPTSAVVQACRGLSTEVVCAVTLFPAKWQDYELIGDWKLGSVTGPKRVHRAHFDWRPAKPDDHEFALVTLESRKDTTVEIRIAANLVCTSDGTTVASNDQFFAVQGRVLGEQRNTPEEMRLRIDNVESGFVGMMKQACRSRVGA